MAETRANIWHALQDGWPEGTSPCCGKTVDQLGEGSLFTTTRAGVNCPAVADRAEPAMGKASEVLAADETPAERIEFKDRKIRFLDAQIRFLDAQLTGVESRELGWKGQIGDLRRRNEALEAELRAAERATAAEAAVVVDRDQRIESLERSRANHIAGGARKDKEIVRLRELIGAARTVVEQVEADRDKVVADLAAETAKVADRDREIRDLNEALKRALGDRDRVLTRQAAAVPASETDVREVLPAQARFGDRVTRTGVVVYVVDAEEGIVGIRWDDLDLNVQHVRLTGNGPKVTRPVEPGPSLPIPQGEDAVIRCLFHGYLPEQVAVRRRGSWAVAGTYGPGSKFQDDQIRQVLAVLDEGKP